MKPLCFLIIVLTFFSCQKDNEPIETTVLPTTLIELEYPTGMGHTGDSVYGLMGYGYDASGLRDALSARARVINCTENMYQFMRPFETGSTLISGTSFYDFKLNFAKIEDPIVLSSHIYSLMKLAFKSDSIEKNCGYVYYSVDILLEFRRLFLSSLDIETNLTPEFKNDATTLTAAELIAKYGTHVLTMVGYGSKYEILYKCDFKGCGTDEDAEQGFHNTMNKLYGFTPFTFGGEGVPDSDNRINEYMIYNNLGSKQKECGLINVTGHNPDSIRLNFNSIKEPNIRISPIGIYEDGIMPLYDFITDQTKKEEVKKYIESYIRTPIIY